MLLNLDLVYGLALSKNRAHTKYCRVVLVDADALSNNKARTLLLVALIEDWYLCLLVDLLSLAKGKSTRGRDLYRIIRRGGKF